MGTMASPAVTVWLMSPLTCSIVASLEAAKAPMAVNVIIKNRTNPWNFFI